MSPERLWLSAECLGCLSASCEWAVCLPLASGLSACLLRVGHLWVQDPGFLELPSIVLPHRAHYPLRDTTALPSALWWKWIFLWFISNLLAFALTVLLIGGFLLFYKVSWVIKDKWVPLVLFLSLHLHILSNVFTHCLHACIYPSNLKPKGGINFYMHLATSWLWSLWKDQERSKFVSAR